jgi:hypothetical protein
LSASAFLFRNLRYQRTRLFPRTISDTWGHEGLGSGFGGIFLLLDYTMACTTRYPIPRGLSTPGCLVAASPLFFVTLMPPAPLRALYAHKLLPPLGEECPFLQTLDSQYSTEPFTSCMHHPLQPTFRTVTYCNHFLGVLYGLGAEPMHKTKKGGAMCFFGRIITKNEV